MPGKAVKNILESMRKNNRRTVVMPATLDVGSFNFDCTAYDVSLGGIRLKVDLPIEKGTNVYVQLKSRLKRTAEVVWSGDGFVGLIFRDNPDAVRASLGSVAHGLK